MEYTYILWSVYFIGLILVILEQYQEKGNMILLYCYAVLLVCVAGFRPIDGTLDTAMYFYCFEKLQDLSSIISTGWKDMLPDVHIEYGYIIFNIMLKTIVDEPYILILIISCISVMAYYKVFVEVSPYPALSFLCYCSTLYIFKDVVQIRNGIACSITLLALFYLAKGKIKKYVCLILVGGSFHLVGLGGGLFYFLKKINWTRRKMLLCIASSCVLLNIEWIYWFLYSVGDNTLVDLYRVTRYLNTDVATKAVSDYKMFAYLLLLFILGSKRDLYKDNIFNCFLGILAMGIVIHAGLHEFRELADRFTSTFYTSLCVLIPIYVKNCRYKYFVLVVFLFALFLYYMRTVNWLLDPLK